MGPAEQRLLRRRGDEEVRESPRNHKDDHPNQVTAAADEASPGDVIHARFEPAADFLTSGRPFVTFVGNLRKSIGSKFRSPQRVRSPGEQQNHFSDDIFTVRNALNGRTLLSVWRLSKKFAMYLPNIIHVCLRVSEPYGFYERRLPHGHVRLRWACVRLISFLPTTQLEQQRNCI